jgi:hypothetical protein
MFLPFSSVRWFGVVLLALSCAALGQSQPLFTTFSSSTVAPLPLAVASADFNGDGIADAAVTSSGSNVVSVLLGAPGGGFQPAVNYPVGPDPVAIVAGDLNHDGHPDLVVVNSNPNTGGANGSISVLFGQGDGTFAAAVTYGVGLVPTAIAMADFDGDGNQDLAVVVGNPNFLFNPGYVTVMLGSANGTFGTQVNYNVEVAPVSIAVGDFNGDGKPDLAVGNSLAGFTNPQSEVSVLLNNGSGSFGGAVNFAVGTTGTIPISLAAADFNNDGRLDLAVAVNNSNALLIAQGNGDGTFTGLGFQAVGNNPVWLAAGDLNGDGKMDLAAANNSDNTVSILLGNGDLTFTAANVYSVGNKPTNLVLADLNSDARLDLAVVNNSDNALQVLLGEGNGSFRSGSYSVGTSSPGFTSGDFNGDGVPDLAVKNSDATVTVFLADGKGGFRALAPFNSCLLGPMTAGDFDGDGKRDLAIACNNSLSTPGFISFYLGNGDGTFSIGPVFPADFVFGIAAADLNGDGVSEAIWAQANTTVNSVVFTNLNGFSGTAQIGGAAMGVMSGDFNGDGKMDLLVLSNVAGDTPLLGDGQGNFQALPPVALGTSLTVADFNGDRLSDFAYSDNMVEIELSNGDGSFRQAYTIPCCALASNAGDFNGDAIPDIVGLPLPGFAGADVYLGQLDGSFAASGTSLPYDPNSFTAIGDFDNNGSPDLAILDPVAGQLFILLNTHSFQPSSTSLAESPATAVAGQPITLTATVGSKQGTPTGTVVFKQGDVVQTTTPLTSGQALASLNAPSVAGQVSYTALYTGDGVYSGSLSTRVLLSVSAAGTTTIVTSNAPNSKLGQSVTFTATVTPQYSGTPTGTVEFFADGQPLGSAALAGRQAALSTTALTQGTHRIEADYSGDGSFQTSLGTVKQNVGRAASTVVLTSSLNPAIYGQAVTLTATVTDSDGTVPTGSILFAEGATVYGNVSLNAGVAQITLPTLLIGTHNIAAQYGGDSSNGPAQAKLAEVITGLLTTTTVSSSAEPSNYGQTVTFTAFVSSSGGTPDGTITFKNGSVSLGTATLSGGQASLAVSTLNAGPHTINAVYSGSSVYAKSTGTLAQIVEPAATTTGITSSLNPAPVGQSVTFTATVTAVGAPTPNGNVTFMDGTTTLATVVLAGAQAQFSTSTLTAGSHTITAAYQGSKNFVTSQASLSQTIQ